MAQVSKILTDDLVAKAKAGLKQLGRYGSVAARLQIIILHEDDYSKSPVSSIYNSFSYR